MATTVEGELPYGTYDIELGGDDNSTYHTLKIDFKPKSVGELHETYIAESADQRSIQMAVAKEDGSIATIYKGSSNSIPGEREYLMVDKGDGRLHLERLTSNIQLKKTRDSDTAILELFDSKIRPNKSSGSTTSNNNNNNIDIELDLLGEISEDSDSDSSSSSSSNEAAEAIERLVEDHQNNNQQEAIEQAPPSSVSTVHNDLYMSESDSE